MFIGHYGVALAAKPIRKTIPLWLLFIAVQWLAPYLTYTMLVEQEYPHLKENILSAMGNVDTGRLLDPRFLNLDSEPASPPNPELFPIVTEL